MDIFWNHTIHRASVLFSSDLVDCTFTSTLGTERFLTLRSVKGSALLVNLAISLSKGQVLNLILSPIQRLYER